MLVSAVDLELEQMAFQLVEPGTKSPDRRGRQDQTTQAKNRTGVVLGIMTIHKRADVTELIQICDVEHIAVSQKHESPQQMRGPRNESV
jgi:hypothetical protein